MTFVLTGLDIDAKAELVQRQLEAGLTARPAELEWTLARTDHPDADTEEAASALLRCVVRDPDPAKVGRAFSSAAVEMALASYPGFHVTAPPGEGQSYGVFTPGYVDAGEVPHVAVHADGTPRRHRAGHRHPRTGARRTAPPLPEPLPAGPTPARAARPDRRRAQRRQGRQRQRRGVGAHRRAVALAGPHADRREAARIAAGDGRLTVTRHLLPNLRAVNFVIEGILGEGVAYQARFDPQAKGLGEWLRTRHVDIPGRAFLHVSMWDTPEREQLRKTVRAFAEREVLPHVDEWERDRRAAPRTAPQGRRRRAARRGPARGRRRRRR